MAAVLPVAALAMQVGGQLYQGYAENKAARGAPPPPHEKTPQALVDGEQEVGDIVREARFQQGSAAASTGTGLLFGGSISAVLADSSLQADMDIQRVRDAAVGQANSLRAQAVERRKAGKAAFIGAGIGALATAVNGASAMRTQGRATAQQGRENSVRLGGSFTKTQSVKLGAMQ